MSVCEQMDRSLLQREEMAESGDTPLIPKALRKRQSVAQRKTTPCELAGRVVGKLLIVGKDAYPLLEAGFIGLFGHSSVLNAVVFG